MLLIYDHLLTLESEVRYIWTTDHTRALAWYLLVRYFALCTDVTIFALSFVDFSVKVCANIFMHLKMVQSLVRCANIYASEIHATVEPTIGRCITVNTVQDVLVALQELMIGSRTPLPATFIPLISKQRLSFSGCSRCIRLTSR